MDKYIKELTGITYFEWVKLKTSVDRAFDEQKGEFERSLKFASPDTASNLIRSQFGQT